MTYPYSTTPHRYSGRRTTSGTLDTYVYVESLDEDYHVLLKVEHTFERGDRWTPDDYSYDITGYEILEAVTDTMKLVIADAIERHGDELVESEWEAIRWE